MLVNSSSRPSLVRHLLRNLFRIVDYESDSLQLGKLPAKLYRFIVYITREFLFRDNARRIHYPSLVSENRHRAVKFLQGCRPDYKEEVEVSLSRARHTQSFISSTSLSCFRDRCEFVSSFEWSRQM